MNTDDFINQNFKIVYRIHEQCEKLSFSPDVARLLAYIHFRLFDSETSCERVDIDHSEVAEVIDLLIDNKKNDISSKNSNCSNPLLEIPEKLNILDNRLREDYGMELRVYSEVTNRIRLHRDSAFQKKMIKIYREKILPCLLQEENVT